jgi:ABC-type transport system involved in multi-copper enzyme maturation permease subunit
MRAIALVAGAVFRESVRDRVPFGMVIFATLLLGASFLIAQLTAGQDMKIIKDLGLAALSIFGLLIAVFIGIGLVSKEVERKSIYALITKPISREQFILGKYAGLVFTLITNLSAMTAVFYLVLLYMNATTSEIARQAWPAPAMDPRLLVAVTLILAELMVVTALALFFSTFSSPLLSTVLTLGFWVAGHFSEDLRQFNQVVEMPIAAWIAKALYYVLPNLSPFDIKAEVVHGMPVPAMHVAYTLAYAVLYISILLLGAIAIFRRRDFK